MASLKNPCSHLNQHFYTLSGIKSWLFKIPSKATARSSPSGNGGIPLPIAHMANMIFMLILRSRASTPKPEPKRNGGTKPKQIAKDKVKGNGNGYRDRDKKGPDSG